MDQVPPPRPPRRRHREARNQEDSGGGQRQRRVNLRLSEQEHAELSAAAATANITLAAYVARAALEAASELLPPDAFEYIVAMMKLRGELARVGTNLNQIARQLNAGGGYVPAHLREATDELRALLEHFDNASLDLTATLTARRAARRRKAKQTAAQAAPEQETDAVDTVEPGGGQFQDWYEPEGY